MEETEFNSIAGICIYTFLSDLTYVENCSFESTEIGIQVGIRDSPLQSSYQNPACKVFESNFSEIEFGITIAMNTTNEVILEKNMLDIEDIGISIVEFSGDNYSININDNQISGGNIGISLENGDEVAITFNTLTDNLIGMYLSQISSPIIVNNLASAVGLTQPESGIVCISSNGEIRKNTIEYHSFGIELGTSSPNLAQNNISNNLEYGIYIGSDSHPDMGEFTSGGYLYPLTGFNTLEENGICVPASFSEIYLSDRSTVDLSSGCNNMIDDREDSGPPLSCNYLLLIDGDDISETIYAEENYWGDHPVYGNDPSNRIGGGLDVVTDDFLSSVCTYSSGGGELLLLTSGENVIDSVESYDTAPSEMSDLELRYSNANDHFYNNNFTSARQEYYQIVQNYSDNRGAINAYNKLLTIEKRISTNASSFDDLRDYYLSKLNGLTDSVMIGTITHLSNLCLVAAGHYENAINNFDAIVQANPNTELALYREIDALTTALLLEGDSTSLNKGTLGKYSSDGISDYSNKVRDLLKNRGKSGTENTNEQIPTEYSLYQNYPNPFNPVTTIKYDLPKTGKVELIVYDILGRRVKTIVDQSQEAGRYEVKWDASNVASGIYIYQLRTETYINSKKMILLK